MRQSHLIISNAAIMWVTRVLLLVPQLVLVPYLIRTIGDAGYGVYALVWSLMVSIDQLQDALQQGVVKYSAALLGKNQIAEVSKVISSSFAYSAFLAVLASGGILLAATLYNDPTGKVTSALFVVAATVLFVIPLTPYVAVIQSKQRYYVSALAETISKYASLLAVVLWFRVAGPSVEAPIAIMAGALLLSRFAQVPIAYRFLPGLTNRPSTFDWGYFRLIVSFGGVVVFVGLCATANTTGVRWMMGILASTSFVAHLAIMLMPGLLLSQIILAMTMTVMPATSAYEATGNQKMLQELLIRGIRYSTLITVAGLLAATLLMRNLLTLWVGSTYEFLTPYALILFGSTSFMLTTSTSHHMLKGLGRLRVTFVISLVGLVVVPAAMILAVFRTWHDPYLAATAGLAVGNAVYGILQIMFGARAVCGGLLSLLTRGYVQPLLFGGLIAAPTFVLTSLSGTNGIVGRTIIAALAEILFFGACYCLIATTDERQQLRTLFHAVASRATALTSKAE